MGDSDKDGLSDYDEFVAGTDPRNAGTGIHFMATELSSNRTAISLGFTSIPGSVYSLKKFTNQLSETTVASGILASNWLTSVSVPILTSEPVALFRVLQTQASTTTQPLPNDYGMTVTRTSASAVQLAWSSPNHCGFRVEYSPDGTHWQAASDWIQSQGGAMTFTVTGPAALAGNVYRLQVSP